MSDLQVTGEQGGSLGLGHHGDLLEGQEVVDVDVVLCGVIPNNSWCVSQWRSADRAEENAA